MQHQQATPDGAAAELGMSSGLGDAHGHQRLRAAGDIQVRTLVKEADRTVLQAAIIDEYRRFGAPAMSALLATTRPGRAPEALALGGAADPGLLALSTCHPLPELDGAAFCKRLQTTEKAVTAC